MVRRPSFPRSFQYADNLVFAPTDVAELPARVLYEDVLPAVVAEHCDPPVPYHRGSPYGGKGWDTADPTIGDVHQWNIWGGKELPYHDYAKLGGRFVSCVFSSHRFLFC